MSNIPQTVITLGGYSFVTNPPQIKFDQPISATYTPTWSGGYINKFGQYTTDFTTEMDFPVLNYAQYQQLETLKAAMNNVTYVDPQGVSHTVFIMEVSNTSLLPAGLNAYTGVKCMLRFISTP